MSHGRHPPGQPTPNQLFYGPAGAELIPPGRAESKEEIWRGLSIEDVSNSHLFRHASEITRETKGGYLQGRVKLPESVPNRREGIFFRLSLVRGFSLSLT